MKAAASRRAASRRAAAVAALLHNLLSLCLFTNPVNLAHTCVHVYVGGMSTVTSTTAVSYVFPALSVNTARNL